jgi:hypothetical protein
MSHHFKINTQSYKAFHEDDEAKWVNTAATSLISILQTARSHPDSRPAMLTVAVSFSHAKPECTFIQATSTSCNTLPTVSYTMLHSSNNVYSSDISNPEFRGPARGRLHHGRPSATLSTKSHMDWPGTTLTIRTATYPWPYQLYHIPAMGYGVVNTFGTYVYSVLYTSPILVFDEVLRL